MFLISSPARDRKVDPVVEQAPVTQDCTGEQSMTSNKSDSVFVSAVVCSSHCCTDDDEGTVDITGTVKQM